MTTNEENNEAANNGPYLPGEDSYSEVLTPYDALPRGTGRIVVDIMPDEGGADVRMRAYCPIIVDGNTPHTLACVKLLTDLLVNIIEKEAKLGLYRSVDGVGDGRHDPFHDIGGIIGAIVEAAGGGDDDDDDDE